MAFSLAFFLIFHRPPKPPTAGEKDDDGPANPYFEDPNKSLMKTIVMSLTGEIEFENIAFTASEDGAGTLGDAYTKFLFLLYVFFVMLVLINLLNGLAVSDISDIQKHAEIVSLESRVELISFTESMLLGDPFKVRHDPLIHFTLYLKIEPILSFVNEDLRCYQIILGQGSEYKMHEFFFLVFVKLDPVLLECNGQAPIWKLF